MLFGLANDEIGYIIPQRQWDRPAAVRLRLVAAQYGEINSCGPDVAPVSWRRLRERVAALAAADRRLAVTAAPAYAGW